MELQTQSSLNLQVNKEDLLDILIDEQLSSLEARKEELSNQMKVINEKMTNIHKKKDKQIEKELMKHLPKGLVYVDPPTLQYQKNHPYTGLTFAFDQFTITVNKKTFDTKYKFTPAEEKELKTLTEEYQKLNTITCAINGDINNINSNNKRVKAKMLRAFLTKTEEGKGILKSMGIPNVKFLQIDDKKSK